MVLPGIQALFGFQFVAVFNASFGEKLTPGEQRLHLAALLCVAIAAALVLAPAALHRQTQPRSVSDRFLDISSRLLKWSMAPLALGTAADVYIVARLIMHSVGWALASALLALATFALLWVYLPSRVGKVPPIGSARR